MNIIVDEHRWMEPNENW